MSVSVNFSALRRTKWYEYTARFLFGGAITALAGLLAQHFGPVIGGLFFAFPAIFPASATLVEKHERAKKTESRNQKHDPRPPGCGRRRIWCSNGLSRPDVLRWRRLEVNAGPQSIDGAFRGNRSVVRRVHMDLAVSQVPFLPQSLTLFLPACLHSSLNTGRPSQAEALFQVKCPLNGIKCVLVSASLGRLNDDLKISLIVIVRCESSLGRPFHFFYLVLSSSNFRATMHVWKTVHGLHHFLEFIPVRTPANV